MNNNWMAASSFGRAYEVISAINILSIHAKLAQIGDNDPQKEEAISKARITLAEFLRNLEKILTDAEKEQDGVIVGSDPRMSELAQTFILEKQSFPQPSDLFRLPLARFQYLLFSEKPGDMPELITLLRDFRTVIEQHSHADVIGILGDL